MRFQTYLWYRCTAKTGATDDECFSILIACWLEEQKSPSQVEMGFVGIKCIKELRSRVHPAAGCFPEAHL